MPARVQFDPSGANATLIGQTKGDTIKRHKHDFNVAGFGAEFTMKHPNYTGSGWSPMAMNNSDAGFGLSNQQHTGAHWVHITEHGAAETAPKHTYFAFRLVSY